MLSTIDQLRKNSGYVAGKAFDETAGALAEQACFFDFGCIDFTGTINSLLKFVGIAGSAMYEVELHFDGWESRRSYPQDSDLSQECKYRYGIDCGSAPSATRPNAWLVLPVAALASLASLRAIF